jgi:hypothetical protein
LCFAVWLHPSAQSNPKKYALASVSIRSKNDSSSEYFRWAADASRIEHPAADINLMTVGSLMPTALATARGVIPDRYSRTSL